MLGLAGLMAPPVEAQEAESSDTTASAKAKKTGSGFFAVGINAIDLGPLNSRLSGSGYPTFPSTLFAIGGGGHGAVGGWLLLGGEGYGLIAPSRGF